MDKPTDLEKQITQTAKDAIEKAIVSELSGYNKPLSKMIVQVMDDNSDELYGLVNDEFVNLMRSEGFKQALGDALNAKLARTLIARMGGELEKRVNDLNSNPTTRAKLTLAIEQIIEANHG